MNWTQRWLSCKGIVEADVPYRHVFVPIVDGGMEFAVAWCEECGTGRLVEYGESSGDMRTTFRRVPRKARGFVEEGMGI